MGAAEIIPTVAGHTYIIVTSADDGFDSLTYYPNYNEIEVEPKSGVEYDVIDLGKGTGIEVKIFIANASGVWGLDEYADGRRNAATTLTNVNVGAGNSGKYLKVAADGSIEYGSPGGGSIQFYDGFDWSTFWTTINDIWANGGVFSLQIDATNASNERYLIQGIFMGYGDNVGSAFVSSGNFYDNAMKVTQVDWQSMQLHGYDKNNTAKSITLDDNDNWLSVQWMIAVK